MTNLTDLTTSQLHRVIAIKERIEKLQGRIDSITADSDFPIPMMATKSPRRRSAAVRARMAAAARARWAKLKGQADSKPAKKRERRLSATGRAAIIAGTKARWAKVKAGNGEDNQKKRRKVSAAVKAKMAAATRARWATARAQGKNRL